jgi:hypothetical protein
MQRVFAAAQHSRAQYDTIARRLEAAGQIGQGGATETMADGEEHRG